MFVRKNRLKEKIANGQIVTGMEIWLRDPRIIELMGDAGFDFVHIENEHVANNWESIENIIRTAELAGLTPVYRTEQCVHGEVPVNEIIKAIKCGAQIVKVPHVETPEVARKVVAAAKFPPMGTRGIATCDRSAREIVPSGSAHLDVIEWARQANEETQVWVIVETAEGLKNVEAIMDVDGVDAVGFGHQDYAISAGLASDTGPEVQAARAKVMQAALSRGKQMWLNTSDPKVIEENYQKGIRIFRLGLDVLILNNWLRQAVETVKTVNTSARTPVGV